MPYDFKVGDLVRLQMPDGGPIDGAISRVLGEGGGLFKVHCGLDANPAHFLSKRLTPISESDIGDFQPGDVVEVGGVAGPCTILEVDGIEPRWRVEAADGIVSWAGTRRLRLLYRPPPETEAPEEPAKTSRPFRVGDLVEVLCSPTGSIGCPMIGKRFRVQSTRDDSSDVFLDDGCGYHYSPSGLKLIKAADETSPLRAAVKRAEESLRESIGASFFASEGVELSPGLSNTTDSSADADSGAPTTIKGYRSDRFWIDERAPTDGYVIVHDEPPTTSPNRRRSMLKIPPILTSIALAAGGLAIWTGHQFYDVLAGVQAANQTQLFAAIAAGLLCSSKMPTLRIPRISIRFADDKEANQGVRH